MLTKLIKHELRATAKTFLWLYIAFAAIALVNMFIGPWSRLAPTNNPAVWQVAAPSAVQVILVILYFLAVVAIAVVTLVIVIQRFYRNLLGDEGYLMMTLPVSREQHVLAKGIVALIWNLCTTVLIILSVLLFVSAAGSYANLAERFQKSFIDAGAPVGQWILWIALLLIVSTIAGILMLYAAMAWGPNLIRNRVGGSILAFIILYVASQFVSLAIMFGAGQMFDIVNITAGLSATDATGGYYGSEVLNQIINSVSVILLIAYAVIAVACWFLTRYMLNKKLNMA